MKNKKSFPSEKEIISLAQETATLYKNSKDDLKFIVMFEIEDLKKFVNLLLNKQSESK